MRLGCILASLAFKSVLVYGETTTTAKVLLFGFDEQKVYGSVVDADPTATAYSLDCGDPSASDYACGIPPTFTFTSGPSTVHFEMSGYGDDSSTFYEYTSGCVITASEHGVCSLTEIRVIDTQRIGSTTSMSFFASDYSSAVQVATITGGLESQRTRSDVMGSTTSSESSPTPTSQISVTFTSAKDSSVSTMTTLSSLASSSLSTAGAPQITSGPWYIGAAAAFAVVAI